MVDFKSRWDSVTDRGKWAATGASFMTKVKATKAVWFPPEPAATGKKKTAAAKKTTGAAKRATSSAR